MSTTLRAASGSSAENLFISLFEDVFGAEKTGYLYSQYPFFDIYQDSRFADFLLENGGRRVAIEIDDDASHLPGHVSQVKHYDDLTKQNSMCCCSSGRPRAMPVTPHHIPSSARRITLAIPAAAP